LQLDVLDALDELVEVNQLLAQDMGSLGMTVEGCVELEGELMGMMEEYEREEEEKGFLEQRDKERWRDRVRKAAERCGGIVAEKERRLVEREMEGHTEVRDGQMERMVEVIKEVVRVLGRVKEIEGNELADHLLPLR
jgi:hypothetical protein